MRASPRLAILFGLLGPSTLLADEANHPRAEDFASFLGLRRGDGADQVEATFGKPGRAFDGDREGTRCVEYPAARRKKAGPFWALIVCYVTATRKVAVVQASGDSLDFYKAHGVTDPKLALFGLKKKDVERRLGKASSASPDGAGLTWRFDKAGARGAVTLTPADLSGWRLGAIEVDWEY